MIVLIEIQTEFNRDFVLRLIDYSVRSILKYHKRLIPLVLLLTPSSEATGFYEDELITFNYHVVNFGKLSAKDYMGEIYLYPFFPLMKEGGSLIEKIEKEIYESQEIEIDEKADLLTAMAIFAGLKDKEMSG